MFRRLFFHRFAVFFSGRIVVLLASRRFQQRICTQEKRGANSRPVTCVVNVTSPPSTGSAASPFVAATRKMVSSARRQALYVHVHMHTYDTASHVPFRRRSAFPMRRGPGVFHGVIFEPIPRSGSARVDHRLQPRAPRRDFRHERAFHHRRFRSQRRRAEEHRQTEQRNH